MVEICMLLGRNAKEVMDSIEIAKYLFSTILTLFPDTLDTPGKCIAIIIDNGSRHVISSIIT